jgi:hypothetical protein
LNQLISPKQIIPLFYTIHEFVFFAHQIISARNGTFNGNFFVLAAEGK